MESLLRFCFGHKRTVVTLLIMIILSGLISYISIPKESTPDVKIPLMYVSVGLDGISPEDSEKLLLRPLEQQIRSIEGIKEMRSTAYEGGGNIIVEFYAGYDLEKAKRDVKDKVDIAKSSLPKDVREPSVNEINLSLIPVLVVKLSGHVENRVLYKIADDLKERIEGNVSSVLSADIVGNRKEMVEINVDPKKFETYNLNLQNTISAFSANNLMISAGNLDYKSGRFPLKVPGLIENVDDIMNIPLNAEGESVLKFKDIADIRSTFKDAESIARDKGQPTVSLQITKRTGENIIETVEKVRAVVEAVKPYWPAAVSVSFSQDQSNKIKDLLTDLQNNLIMAVLLVMVVIILSMGVRPALLVGVSVPGSFLMGILIISSLGSTLNLIVLFSLILSIGMLVDASIIVVEYADRKMIEGIPRAEAYKEAVLRMTWPVISSVVTILAVFMPLLFWPGVVGQFMKFMPITLIATLGSSLVMALVFVPTLGAMFAKVEHDPNSKMYQSILAAEEGHFEKVTGVTKYYINALKVALDHPGRVLLGAFALLFCIIFIYGKVGKGVEFFPKTEPESASISIQARGNLSLEEKDKLVYAVESKILDMKELQSIYATAGTIGGMGNAMQGEAPADQVGTILLEFTDWKERRKADVILAEILERTKDIPGIHVDITTQKMGPPGSKKPIKFHISSMNPDLIFPTLLKVREKLDTMKGITGIEDNRYLPGIQWNVWIDRVQAAKFGCNIQLVGTTLKMITNGIKIGTYRPTTSKDEIDVIVRFPEEYRNLDELKRIKVQNMLGQSVPIASFIEEYPGEKVGVIHRLNGNRVLTVLADIEPGTLASDKLKEFQSWLKTASIDPQVTFIFQGEDKDQKEAMAFLSKAFIAAIFLIALILVTQFNSFFSMGLIMSAVLLSIIGVFVGLMVHRMPFGIVMGGIGVISLAGIIVSNNIILIDTFDRLSHEIKDIKEVLLRTCAQRLRPVILTKLTIILGLLPIMYGVNIDFVAREVSIGSPVTQFWTLLATCIVYGVLFASLLTLFVTPCSLMLREKYRQKRRIKKHA